LQENYAAKTVSRLHSKQQLLKCVQHSVTFECSKVESHYAKNLRMQTEIVAQIPHLVNDQNRTTETQTQIMYKSFVSYAQLKEYLTILIQNGLLEYLDGTKSYRTTEKGLKFLKMMHEQIEELMTTERNLSKTQKKGLEEMQGWASKVKKATKKAKFGIMTANNHYAGFGPAVLSRENITPSSMKHLL
jgi:predicted transcriptional regulator